MIFDGIKFRRTKKVVTMPEIHRNENGAYVVFGRICDKSKKNAVLTNWNINGEPVYAKKVKSKGYSLTNMMYGTDGFIYLYHKGHIYLAKYESSNKTNKN